MSTPLALAMLGAGLVLMTAAFRNESPIDVVLIALGRGPSTPAKLGAGGSTLGLSKPAGAGGSSGTANPGPPSAGSGAGGGGGGSW